MQKKYLLLTFLTSMSLTAAQAQDGIYLSLDAGVANQTGLPTQDAANATSLDISHTPNALRLGAGYTHDFNVSLGIGLEIAAGQYGKATYNYADDTNTEVVSSTVEFLATSIFHVKKYDIFAKVGGLRLTPEVSGKNAPAEDTQIRFEGAIGSAYNFTPHFAVTLTYAHVFGSQVNTISDLGPQTPGLDEGLLGVRYMFGS